MGAVDDAVALVGHQVHVCRFREAGTLVRWLGDVRGQRVLDVAGGDGYWAGRLRRRGAVAVNVDVARRKLVYGNRLSTPALNLEADALRLPFADASFDAVMSVCAIEHFADGGAALDEMTRVLRPGGRLVMSADALTDAAGWPALFESHKHRFAVRDTYDRDKLTGLLERRGLSVVAASYQFRAPWAQRMYLSFSRLPSVALNLAAPMAPLVAWSDRRQPADRGSVLLMHAVKATA